MADQDPQQASEEPAAEVQEAKKKKKKKKRKKRQSIDASAQTPTGGDPGGLDGKGAASGEGQRKDSSASGNENDRRKSSSAPATVGIPIENLPESGPHFLIDEDDDPDLYEYDEFGVAIRKKSDPAMIAKRQQAEMKNKLASGADAAIKKAVMNLSRDQNKAKLQGSCVFIIACLLTIVGAIHVQILNSPFGPPPTRDAAIAATSLLPSLIFNAVLASAAFVILYLKFSQLIIAFAWFTLLAYLQYLTSINLSKSAVTVHKGSFEDIKLYSKDYYDDFRRIPEYVAHYEIIGNCCGWGDPTKKFQAWPKLLDSEDFPDSCCINRFHGCGKGAIQRSVPSGYILKLSSTEYAAFLGANRGQLDTNFFFDKVNPLSRVLSQFSPANGFPDELLRLVDEVQDAPMFYYMSQDFNKARNDMDVFVYKSFGQSERFRLQETIKAAVCDTSLVTTAMRFHALIILIYSTIQMCILLVMAVVFWYYFVDLRADHLGRQPIPGEFTMLKMERICLDDRFNDILREKKRMDQIQNLKESYKKEEEERNRLLDEADDGWEEGENKEEAPKEKKKPKIIFRKAILPKSKVEPA